MANNKTPFMDYFRKRWGAYAIKDQLNSKKWFQDLARRITRFSMPNRALKNTLNGGSPIGKMIFFHYDPKLKDKLPYYDTMPLVMVLGVGPNYMLGLNLHYLPPDKRAQLMDFFVKNATANSGGELNSQSASTLDYRAIRAIASDRLIKPTIKKYLHDHFVTAPVVVNPVEWEIVMFLPTARWVGQPQGVTV